MVTEKKMQIIFWCFPQHFELQYLLLRILWAGAVLIIILMTIQTQNNKKDKSPDKRNKIDQDKPKAVASIV